MFRISLRIKWNRSTILFPSRNSITTGETLLYGSAGIIYFKYSFTQNLGEQLLSKKVPCNETCLLLKLPQLTLSTLQVGLMYIKTNKQMNFIYPQIMFCISHWFALFFELIKFRISLASIVARFVYVNKILLVVCMHSLQEFFIH